MRAETVGRFSRTNRKSTVPRRIERNETSVDVEDVGKGIPLQNLSGGVGLPGMRERLRHLGGNLQME
jgi:signal transduction histidine kinase